MKEIGHVTGFPLSAGALIGGCTTISTPGGGVIRHDGKTFSYGVTSISISRASSGEKKRVYMVDPGLLESSVAGNEFRCLPVSCDDDEMPRGAYEGGLIVLGHIELTVEPPPSMDDPEKLQDPRERTSMLRIIRALAEMAELPDKGATASVEAQLQQLGFASPKEAAIRKLLKEASNLQAD
ncbi:MAG: hypothetical protein JSR63_06065 [Proteobacteria bacterium]|nr:hypothetical protein [Pseudomonadota bacterium]